MKKLYYHVSVDCDMYFVVEVKGIRLTVPAFGVFDKECYSTYNSSENFSFRYYCYLFNYDVLHSPNQMLVFNRKTNKESYVPLVSITIDEYEKFSIPIIRDSLLLEPYDRLVYPRIDFIYGSSPFIWEEHDCIDLHTLYSSNQISTVKYVLKWLTTNFEHISKDTISPGITADAIIRESSKSGKKLNCRNLAVVLNAIYLSCNMKSRYIICLQKELKVNNSHFYVEVFINELNKWVVVDSSYGLLFRVNNQEYLSLSELRDSLAYGHDVKIESVSNSEKMNSDLYFRLMKVSLYRFMRPILSNNIYNENGPFVQLVPSVYLINQKNCIYTDFPEMFWM